MNIWLAPRGAKGRAARGWERAWAATVWGQPAGIAAAAIAGLATASAPAAIASWLVVVLLSLLAAIRLPATSLPKLGRIPTAALTLLAAATHFALRGGLTSADPVAWIVNLGLIAGGAALLLPELRMRRNRAEPATAAAS